MDLKISRQIGLTRCQTLYRRHGVEKFELDFDPEHTTPARVFRASLPWRAMVVCPENDRNLARIFLPRGPYIKRNSLTILLVGPL